MGCIYSKIKVKPFTNNIEEPNVINFLDLTVYFNTEKDIFEIDENQNKENNKNLIEVTHLRLHKKLRGNKYYIY